MRTTRIKQALEHALEARGVPGPRVEHSETHGGYCVTARGFHSTSALVSYTAADEDLEAAADKAARAFAPN